MNNADLIVKILRDAGVRHGFGVPSGNVLPLMESMRAGGVEFVLMAHEGSAGFAADVTARMTGRAGLCIATLGPGATNLATGVGCAFLDRTPLIAITCTLNEAQLGRRIQMWIDHHGLFKPITKATLRLRRGSVAATVCEALRIAHEEPAGPVHLDLPEDVALAPAAETVPVLSRRTCLSAPRDDVFEKAVGLLRQAKRPVAVIGANAMRMQNPGALKAFVESHRMPFATTTMAKGLIDDAHPLALGCIERACRQLQRGFLRGADLIVGLGYDTIEVEYEVWARGLPVLHVDIERADVDGAANIMHEVIGDLDAALTRLTAATVVGNQWPAEALRSQREAFQRALRPAVVGFSPHQAIDAVRRVLPRDGVLAFDVGAHTHQIASQWTAHAPRTFLITNGWSAMGFAMPAAIAAKLAAPDLPVVSLLGDGCFQMTCGELAVARRLKLSIPFVVLNDGWLSLIRIKQQRRDLELYGTCLGEEDVVAPPAHYFGVPAIAVDSPATLERELAQALTARGPTVLEAHIDPAHYAETVYD